MKNRADVYCLTVPKTATFAIEGGLLVSNCADDWRYACMSRPWQKPIPVEVKTRYQQHRTFDEIMKKQERRRKDNE
jgi:hypothetical protein